MPEEIEFDDDDRDEDADESKTVRVCGSCSSTPW